MNYPAVERTTQLYVFCYVSSSVEGGVAFDWDEANIAHIGRHGVTPEDVFQIFSNEATDLNYEVVNGEAAGRRSGIRTN